MSAYRNFFKTFNARILFVGLRGVRTWGFLSGILIIILLPLTPVGFIPVQSPSLTQAVFAVFTVVAIILRYLFYKTKTITYERALAIVWIFGLFFMYYELGGIDSPYILTITFPLLVESAVADVFWLALVSAFTIVLFFAEAVLEFYLQGSVILFPFIYNGLSFLLFILYFNVVVRNARGYIRGDYDSDNESNALHQRILANERASYIQRLISPMGIRFAQMMNAIDEARGTKNTVLQDALLGLLYEQLYDARMALRTEGNDLLRSVEQPVIIDLKDTIKNVIEKLEPLRTAEATKISVDIIDDIKVMAGVESLAEVLYSLIENALLYSPQGEVRVFGEKINGNYRIVIEDNGIGIPGDFISNAFIRGARAPNATSLRPGRRGQGLCTAQMLANSFNASIDIVAREGQSGTRVSVLIPLSWS